MRNKTFVCFLHDLYASLYRYHFYYLKKYSQDLTLTVHISRIKDLIFREHDRLQEQNVLSDALSLKLHRARTIEPRQRNEFN